MKKTAWIMWILLVATVLLAGCSATKNEDASNEKEERETSEQKGAEEGGAPPSKSGEPVSWDSPDIAWKQDTTPVKFSLYIDFDWYAYDTWGKDDVSQEIERQTGVSLDVTKASDLNQLQVLLATGNLPDIIFTTNQVQKFWNDDIVWPWDELIAQYAPEFMDLLDPVEIVNNTAPDGHFYTLKSHYSNDEQWADWRNVPSVGGPGLAVREDILEALGNPPIDSLEDLLDVLRQVKANYPDMVGYLPHATWRNPIKDMLGMHATLPHIDKDGRVKINFNEPNVLAYLKYMNTLYREGILHPESFTYTTDQFNQLVSSGNVFMASYNTAIADETNKRFKEAGLNDFRFKPINDKVLTYEGKDHVNIYEAGTGWASVFISKNVKDPARAIQFIQFLKSPEGAALTMWGQEGKHYTMLDNGLIERNTEYLESKSVQEIGLGAWYMQVSGLHESIGQVSLAEQDPEAAQYLDVLRFRKDRTTRDPALSFVDPPAESDEYNILVRLRELYANEKVSIILSASEEEVEKKYEQFMKNANQIGLERLENYMNERYQVVRQQYDNL